MDYYPIDRDLVSRLVNGEDVLSHEYLPLPTTRAPIDNQNEKCVRPGCEFETSSADQIEESLDEEKTLIRLGENERICDEAWCNPDFVPT